MFRPLCRLLLGVAVLSIFGASAHGILAEDSGVFKNPGDISQAQRILVELGYLETNGYTTGTDDAATQRALTEYQSRHALNARGTLDDDTYQMLLSHEADYPWASEPSSSLAAAQPVEPPRPAQEEPAQGTHLAEAPPAPEPIPSTATVKETPSPEAPAGEREREMPATASSLPFLGLMGLALLAAGFIILRVRRV